MNEVLDLNFRYEKRFSISSVSLKLGVHLFTVVNESNLFHVMLEYFCERRFDRRDNRKFA